jgi:hypothetical protein
VKKAVLLILALAFPAWGQDVPLSVKGDLVTVKVDRVVVVKEDQTVVRSFPFTVDAPPGAALYFWTYPAGVQAVDKGERLEVVNAPKGMLTINLKAISVDFEKKTFITKFGTTTVAVGDVVPPVPPKPDPPKPDPPKPDPVDPTPIPEPGFRVLIVYETSAVSPQIASILSAEAIRTYAREKCVKDGTTPAFYTFDKDADTTKFFPWVGKAMQRPRTTLPWILVSNGTSGFEGPLPGTVSETLALLRKFGG